MGKNTQEKDTCVQDSFSNFLVLCKAQQHEAASYNNFRTTCLACLNLVLPCLNLLNTIIKRQENDTDIYKAHKPTGNEECASSF